MKHDGLADEEIDPGQLEDAYDPLGDDEPIRARPSAQQQREQ